MKVQLYTPCYMDQLFPNIAWDCIRVLEQYGYQVLYHSNQTCCGKPAFNSGRRKEAWDVGKKLITEMDKDLPIIIPSNSCTGYIKEQFSHLFDNTSVHNDFKKVVANTYELCDFLLEHTKPGMVQHKFEGKGILFNSCGNGTTFGKEGSLLMLEKVEGLTLFDASTSLGCCGFGESFTQNFNSISGEMAKKQVELLSDCKADFVITTDASCLMHLKNNTTDSTPLQFYHIAQILAGNKSA